MFTRPLLSFENLLNKEKLVFHLRLIFRLCLEYWHEPERLWLFTKKTVDLFFERFDLAIWECYQVVFEETVLSEGFKNFESPCSLLCLSLCHFDQEPEETSKILED